MSGDAGYHHSVGGRRNPVRARGWGPKLFAGFRHLAHLHAIKQKYKTSRVSAVLPTVPK